MIDVTFCCILMESIRVWGEKKVLNLLTLLKSHLYSGERDTFSESWNLGLTCNRGEGGHLGSQRVTHHKEGSYLRVYSNLGEQGMAQWWERSPPTNVARVRILASTPYMGWVCCWFSPLLRDLFLRVLRFTPLLKNQHFQIPIRSGTHGHVSTSSYELLSAPWVNKLQYSFTIIEAFTNWTYSLKSIKCTCVNSTCNVVDHDDLFMLSLLVSYQCKIQTLR